MAADALAHYLLLDVAILAVAVALVVALGLVARRVVRRLTRPRR